MPNTTPKCQYDDALGSPRELTRAPRDDRYPWTRTVSPRGRRKHGRSERQPQSFLCAALFAGWYKRYGAVRGERYQAPPHFRH